MKTLLSLYDGAIVVTEQGGVFTLSFKEAANVGGGSVAGIVQVQGAGSLVFSGIEGFNALVSLLKSVLPASVQPIVAAAAAIADSAIAGA